jgi:ABC-2 type transport system ATP-binding protein
MIISRRVDMASRIIVDNLQKVFRVPVRDPGLIPAVKSIICPRFNLVKAVDNVSFNIEKGEIVGFIGPNGAGKTTTLKVLSGLLHPTAGNVSVAGFKPWERKTQYLRMISMLMGNKSQMQWNNTVFDSFYILKEIYHVSTKDFKTRLDELFSLFEIHELLYKQSRNLSLGERAKCELIAALLHNPEILYLDEPTLGMDVTIQLRLRSFIKEYNKKYGTTILLTSHYMSDIVSLCPRVMLIHKGQLMFDGELNRLADRIAPFKLIKLSFGERETIVTQDMIYAAGVHADVIEQDGQSLTLRVKREEALSTSAYFLNQFVLADLSIQDPPIEAVIDQVYREGMAI